MAGAAPYRAKLYELGISGEWIDRGTGHALVTQVSRVGHMEGKKVTRGLGHAITACSPLFHIFLWCLQLLEGPQLSFVCEEEEGSAGQSAQPLFDLNLAQVANVDLKQQEAIIIVEQPLSEFAFSFQDAAGCQEIWYVR